MSNDSVSTTANPRPQTLPRWLTLLLATACGMIVANIYYAQPLVGLISHDLHLSSHAAGLIVTLTQVGYGLGLLFIVPLGDLLENRRLSVSILAISALGLLISAEASTASQMFGAALLVGIGSVTVQILVPYAAHMAPEETRGRVVGNVMSGLMLGIMLARPISSFITDLSSWRTVFFLSLVSVVLVATVLRFALPQRPVVTELRYRGILASMAGLVRSTPALRRRSLYQACMFGAFSLFWTTTPLLLSGPEFGLSQAGIGLFALAGVAGALAAPIGGRMADRNWVKPATGIAMVTAILAFAISHIGTPGSTLSLAMLVLSAITLDFAITVNMVLGQRVIFSLPAELRSRLNSLYMTTFFCGGALGSALGAWSYASYGWMGASLLGIGFISLALLYYLTELKGSSQGA